MVAAGPKTQPLRNRKVRWTQRLAPVWFIGPALLVLIGLVAFPLGFSVFHSLQHWDLELGPLPLQFVGLSNYGAVLTSPLFWAGVKFTLEFVAVVVTTELVLGTGIALLLDQKIPGVHLARALIILPTAVAPVVAGFMFRYMLYPGTGIIPYVAHLLGVHLPAAGILGSSTWAPIGVEMTNVWQWTPFMALVILAGLQAVPQEIIEAARVDGASNVQTYRHIIFPNLRFIMAVALIIRIMQAFNVFSPVYAETKGGPGIATTSLSYLLYQNGLLYYNLGLAFAMGWLVILIAATLVNIYISLAFRGIKL